MQHSAHYRLINVDIAIPDFQVETTIGIGTDPRLVLNIRPLAAEIGKRYQVSSLTTLTFRETVCLLHGGHLPPDLESLIVYTTNLPLAT